MTIKIGNAPCSWGIEFANDPRNPSWEHVLDQCQQAGFKGIELGPVGYMPEDPVQLAEALSKRDLSLIGGVVFQPFHDPNTWDKVLDAATRTCQALQSHQAEYLVLIDSISPQRAKTAGRAQEATQMSETEWQAFKSRIMHVAKIGKEEFGLTSCIHAHAAGFMDFEPELERLLSETDPDTLKICLDTGHSHYAGFDPLAFMDRHMARIAYMHFKDIDPAIRQNVIENRTDFYVACGDGIFCNLGEGEVDFPKVRQKLIDHNFSGWCTIEQDCDPEGATSPLDDAVKNRQYLASIGFE